MPGPRVPAYSVAPELLQAAELKLHGSALNIEQQPRFDAFEADASGAGLNRGRGALSCAAGLDPRRKPPGLSRPGREFGRRKVSFSGGPLAPAST